jgi:hypothetical protein
VAREAAEFPQLCRKFTDPGFLRAYRRLRFQKQTAPWPECIELAVRGTVNLIAERLVVHLSSPFAAGGGLPRKR